jgi:hypothetical protein
VVDPKLRAFEIQRLRFKRQKQLQFLLRRRHSRHQFKPFLKETLLHLSKTELFGKLEKAPLTAKGRFLDIDFSFLGRVGGTWGGGSGVRARIHVALVRRAGWKPASSQPEFRSTAV